MVQANSVSRCERRAERKRKAEIAMKANEQLKGGRGVESRVDGDSPGKENEYVQASSSSRTAFSAQRPTLGTALPLQVTSKLQGSMSEPTLPSNMKLVPNHLARPNNSSEYPVTPTGHTHQSMERTKSAPHNWYGGVKPAGLRGYNASRQSLGPTESAPPALSRPFKSPLMKQPSKSTVDKPQNSTTKQSVVMPETPMTNDRELKTDSADERLTSAHKRDEDDDDDDAVGLDSFDEMFMAGGEDIEALLRACDGVSQK